MQTTHTKHPILNLIKYDLRFIYKQLIVFYIIVIALAIIAKLTSFETSSFWIIFLHNFAQSATFGFSFGMLVNAAMRLWAKYHYSIYGDESYLVHTLPLKRTTIWNAKFLTSLIVLVVSGLLILACIFFINLPADWVGVFGVRDTDFWTVFSLLCLATFCQVAYIMQAGLTGITLGFCHNTAPMARAVIYGLLIYIVSGISIVLACALFNPNLRGMIFENQMFQTPSEFCSILISLIIGYTVLTAITYFTNRAILKRGVNVD